MGKSNTEASNNVALLVAYHFPPQSGSSGLLRTLKYSRYLPDFGWQPVVLTAHPRAYESLDPQGEKSIRTGIPVYRAFALDTKKHLSVRGSYFDWMALPDRWAAWAIGAVPVGLWAIWKHRVRVIFSTFPISTSILIGLMLHLLTRKPWVVDLRDSMTEDEYPKDLRTRRIRRWIERQAVLRSVRVIFTAASTRHMYLERYPELSADKCLLIPNGYDEEDFASIDIQQPSPVPANRPLRLLHTGFIYPEERDPKPFFRALARLKREGQISSSSLHIVFRAPGSEDLYARLMKELEIDDLIQLQPHVPYLQSLQECATADGLLLFQAANCDHQIPAKAYEYLRLRKPIFALTSHSGDTAGLLNETGGATIVDLASEDDIYRGFPAFLNAVREATHSFSDLSRVQRYARRNQAEELAKCLTATIADGPLSAAEKSAGYAGR